MPKQLINTIGALIVVAIFAIGMAAVGLPLYLDSVATQAEAERVEASNAVQAATVERLREEESNSSRLNAELEEMRREIPTTPRVYTISQLISEAAADTEVTITGITPNAPMPFVRGDVAAIAAEERLTGRVQIPVQVNVVAASHVEILEFLDRLREGPRLLGDIEATISSRGGADASIAALAFANIATQD